MDVSGTLEFTMTLDNPDAYIDDAFVNIALKGLVSGLAGHGVEASDITALNVKFTPETIGRRLATPLVPAPAPAPMTGNLVVSYTLTVPESVSGSCASSIKGASLPDMQQQVQLKFAAIGKNGTCSAATMTSPVIGNRIGTMIATTTSTTINTDKFGNTSNSFSLGGLLLHLLAALLACYRTL